MIRQVSDLSPEQKAAAELLLGRSLDERESISVQAFEMAGISEDRRRNVLSEIEKLLSEVDRNLTPVPPGEAEEIFDEAMRSSRPGYRSRR